MKKIYQIVLMLFIFTTFVYADNIENKQEVNNVSYSSNNNLSMNLMLGLTHINMEEKAGNLDGNNENSTSLLLGIGIKYSFNNNLYIEGNLFLDSISFDSKFLFNNNDSKQFGKNNLYSQEILSARIMDVNIGYQFTNTSFSIFAGLSFYSIFQEYDIEIIDKTDDWIYIDGFDNDLSIVAGLQFGMQYLFPSTNMGIRFMYNITYYELDDIYMGDKQEITENRFALSFIYNFGL